MKVLTVAPHPDDETLGCSGTLFKHKFEGDDLYWAIVTGIDEKSGWSKEVINSRQSIINEVSDNYGFKEVFQLNFPSTKIDTIPVASIIKSFADIYKIVKPEVIYMPFISDVHTDHQIICKALNSTFKWFRHPHIKKVLMYETLSETEFNFIGKRSFQPNVFVNVSDYIDDKIKTMKLYSSEMDSYPFPRSEKTIKSLATLRGSQSGFNKAEAFELVYERNS